MIALDIETSGLDPERNSILSIGALDTDAPANQFYGECRVWTYQGPTSREAEISDEALAINGFTREEATDTNKQPEEELIKAFVAWSHDNIQDRTIVGQNSSFDRDFAKAACKRAGIDFTFAHRTLDTHSLVWLHMTERGTTPPLHKGHSGISLNVALEYCGLPTEEKPHNALNGAFAHAEVFARIAYNKKIVPQYSSFEIPWL